MIVIKRKPDSVVDNVFTDVITFKDITIILSEVEYRELQAIIDDDGFKPLEALEIALQEGLWHLNIECD